MKRELKITFRSPKRMERHGGARRVDSARTGHALYLSAVP